MAAVADPLDNIIPPPFPKDKPRSNRMGGLASPSPKYQRSMYICDPPSSARGQYGAPKLSPPLPARSPLRPRPRAIVSSSQVLADARNLVAQVDDMPLSPSYASLSGLLESMDLNEGPLSSEGGPILPGSLDLPSDISPLDDEEASSSVSEASSSVSPAPTPPTMSKRTHALLELLSSERAYASDLALIRDIHIPCALGV